MAADAPAQLSAAAPVRDRTHFRPGVWEIHHETNGVSWPSHQTCLDKPPIAQLFDQNPQATGLACRGARRDIRATAGGYLVDIVCIANGEQAETHAELTGDLETNYLLQTTMRAAGRTLNFRETGQWLGPCPADVTPGEWVGAPHSDVLRRESANPAPVK